MLLVFEEGDGRCVRASWPCSTEHSVPSLLLNPPLVAGFTGTFVWYPGHRKCSPLLPNPWAAP